MCDNRKYIILIWIMILNLIAGVPFAKSLAQDSNRDNVTGDEIKAALVFKFPVYVRWPQEVLNEKSDRFECCVLGSGPVGDLLAQFDGEKMMGKTIEVKQISTIAESYNCHMLFVGSSAEKNLPSILKALADKPVLTVADFEEFIHIGGIINLIRKGDSVHFEINLAAAKKAGLNISSKLLRVADTVIEK